jgi:hypothetical protein
MLGKRLVGEPILVKLETSFYYLVDPKNKEASHHQSDPESGIQVPCCSDNRQMSCEMVVGGRELQ